MNKFLTQLLPIMMVCFFLSHCKDERKLGLDDINLKIYMPHSENRAHFTVSGYIEGSSNISVDLEKKLVKTLDAQLILTFPYPELYFKKWDIPTQNLQYNEIIAENEPLAISENGDHAPSNILNITCTANLNLISPKQIIEETQEYLTIGALVPCEENPNLLAMDLTIEISLAQTKYAHVGIELGRIKEISGAESGLKIAPIILQSENMINF